MTIRYAVQVDTPSHPMFVSWIKSIKGRPLPRYSPHIEQTFASEAEAQTLATRVRGRVIPVTQDQ